MRCCTCVLIVCFTEWTVEAFSNVPTYTLEAGNTVHYFSLYFVAVDDAVVEKLLQLLSDADRSDDDDARAEFSLKSVARMLYQQQQHTDSLHTDTVLHSNDVHQDIDGPCIQPMLPAAVDSSTVDVCHQSEMSCLDCTVYSTASTQQPHETDTLVPCHVYTPRPNMECLPIISLLNCSRSSPSFCVPTVPVWSTATAVASAHRGQALGKRVCRSVGQSVCCEHTTDTDKSSTDVQQTLAVSSNVASNTPTSLCTSVQNVSPLYLRTTLPSVPNLSSTCRVASSVLGCSYSEGSSRTLTTTAEAVSRMCQLLTARCRVLVLMRGCPGSGKTTVARYVCTLCQYKNSVYYQLQ